MIEKRVRFNLPTAKSEVREFSIRINEEADRLLQLIANSEGKDLDENLLSTIVPNPEDFERFVSQQGLENSQAAITILNALRNRGVLAGRPLPRAAQKKAAKPALSKAAGASNVSHSRAASKSAPKPTGQVKAHQKKTKPASRKPR